MFEYLFAFNKFSNYIISSFSNIFENTLICYFTIEFSSKSRSSVISLSIISYIYAINVSSNNFKINYNPFSGVYLCYGKTTIGIYFILQRAEWYLFHLLIQQILLHSYWVASDILNREIIVVYEINLTPALMELTLQRGRQTIR